MIYTIKVPKDLIKEKDIKEIDVITEDEIPQIILRRLIDPNFNPVTISIDYDKNAPKFNLELIKIAYENDCNLVVLGKNNAKLYKAKEVKREGGEFVGAGVGIVIINEKNQVVLTLR